jgi:Origin recognition complex (ORC) subunit 4 C-terminus
MTVEDIKQGLLTAGAVWGSHVSPRIIFQCAHQLLPQTELAEITLGLCEQEQMIASLSILEMFILAALQRLKKQNQFEVNFNIVWKEYSRLKDCSRERHVDSQYNREAACRAFERLMQLGLIAYSR